MAKVPLPEPPTDIFAAEGIRSFVHMLHEAHVRDGIRSPATAYLFVKKHPTTEDVFTSPKMLRVDDEARIADLDLFANAVRLIAGRARAVACVTVVPVALGEGDQLGRAVALGELVLVYLVEHVDPKLSGRCWSAPLSGGEERDAVHIGEKLTEYEHGAEVAGPLANLLPQRTMN